MDRVTFLLLLLSGPSFQAEPNEGQVFHPESIHHLMSSISEATLAQTGAASNASGTISAGGDFIKDEKVFANKPTNN
jgi:hypothetical protein